MPENLLLIVAVALSAFLIGLSKGGLGGTPVILITPMLALVMPAADAIGLALPLLMTGDVFALWFYWNGWDRRVILRMLPGTILGIFIGLRLLQALPPVTLQHAIGVFVLLFCVYKVFGQRFRQNLAHTDDRIWWHGPLFGGGSGLGAALANAGGPIADVYMLMQQMSPATFIGTGALYFALVNLMKLPGFISSGVLRPSAFLQIAWAIPLVPLGVWTGRRFIRRLDMRAFEKLILFLLTVAGVFLLVR